MTYFYCVLLKRTVLLKQEKNEAVALLSTVSSSFFSGLVTSGFLNLQH
jgi:hypothetical protein